MVSSSPTFTTYSLGGPVGILPNQSMFVTDSTRVGQFDARSSFVNICNYIFANTAIAVDRPEAVAALDVTTPISQYLTWRRPAGVQHIEVVPPSTEWDYQVYSLEERNALIFNPTILQGVLSGGTFRVLVNGLGNMDEPQWSVYLCSVANYPIDLPPNATLPASDALSNPSLLFSLAKSYDYEVASFNDRNLLLTSTPAISVGQRVLVDGNSSTNGFWTVWKYVGVDASNPEIDAEGFMLTRYQTYRTSDFWSYVDWYASGYNSANPPVVVYATVAARDAVENPNPETSFVIVEDNGSGEWIWTNYNDGEWTIVAQQNGTIAFSKALYDNPSAPTIGLQPISMADIANIAVRDGSWELRVLFDLLQDANLLEPIEVNQVFFSILHFVHAQQDQVPWAFKTSFLTIGGYNEQLTQTPIEPINNMNAIVDYISEVKPYRVKIRDFTQIYTPPTDVANTHATDFDFPIYYDSNTNAYRFLSLTNPSDLAIIQNTYADWYSSYQNFDFDPASYVASEWNGVRHFTLTLRYDRVDHMPILFYQQFIYNGGAADFTFLSTYTNVVNDLGNSIVQVVDSGNALKSSEFQVSVSNGSVSLNYTPNIGDLIEVYVRQPLTANLAGDRIQRFYDPVGTENPEKNLRNLLGLEFKGHILDGGDFQNTDISDYNVDGNTTGLETDETINPNEQYYGLADPLREKDRPEELVAMATGEGLRITSFDANNALSNVVSWSTARPAPDLYAPQFVGDFDAVPLDTIVFDLGQVQDQETVPIQNVVTAHPYYGQVTNPYAGQSIPVNVIRHDSIEWTTWNNIGGYLQQPLLVDSNSVVISLAVSGVMPFMMPTVELVQNPEANAGVYMEVVTAPGVIWINNERVEYFNAVVNSDTLTLSQIRRGTHNTRIGAEQIATAKFRGDGATTIFTTNTISSTSNVIVAVNQPIQTSTGAVLTGDGYTGSYVNVPKMQYVDYTLSVSNSSLSVTFNTAPPVPSVDSISINGSNAVNIFISQISGVFHPTGTPVYNGVWTFYPGNSGSTPPPTPMITWLTPGGLLFPTISGNVQSGTLSAVASTGRPITYSIASGNLPPSWTLSNSGVYTGNTPVVFANTTYTFEVVATDSVDSISQNRTFEIFVPTNASYSVPEVIQAQVIATDVFTPYNITLTLAPTVGNLLIAAITASNAISAGAGWSTLISNAAIAPGASFLQPGFDSQTIVYKIVDGSDTTNITPSTPVGNGTIAVWEIANAGTISVANTPTLIQLGPTLL